MKPKNMIRLWFDKNAYEAAHFYATVFPDSEVTAVHAAPADYPGGKKGDVLMVEFAVRGIPCLGLNSGPTFRHSEAFSFKFLADKDSPGRQAAQGWEYHSPHLIGEPGTPSYPERPLAKRFGSSMVIVRIAINPAGEVVDVSPEPRSTKGPFAADFFHAVETAVRNWKFTRPEWWLLEEGSDINGDGKPDYQRVIEIKPASASGDVEFLFELVGGQGKVKEW